jgi:hypothetical protein
MYDWFGQAAFVLCAGVGFGVSLWGLSRAFDSIKSISASDRLHVIENRVNALSQAFAEKF